MLQLKIFFVLTCIQFVYGYKIFVYNPKTGPSHVNFVGKVADMLVQAGHDVTVYMPILNKNLQTNGSKLAKVIQWKSDVVADFSPDNVERQKLMWEAKLESGLATMVNRYKMIEFLRSATGALCKNQINDDKIMDQLASEHWDLGIGENFDVCYYGVLKRVGIKNFITISTSALFENYASAMGIPSTPSFVPNIFSASMPPFSYYDRFVNLFNYIIAVPTMHRMFGGYSEDSLNEKFGGFSVLDEHAKSAFYFVNVDEHVDFPRPISHKIIYIGGIGKVQAKPLEKKYADIFEKSKKGVILVSFGSNAQSVAMPERMKFVFLETFKKFPDVTFLWKYENEEENITAGYDNVVTGKWLPQNDLLEHPKLLAFVTHGGMNSVQESSSKGVPMICIPVFADQIRNARMIEYREIGVSLNKDTLTTNDFSAAITEVLENKKYNTNAKRLKAMIDAKPMSAEERIVKYTNFAAKFGPDLNLNMDGQNLNFVQFYCLDIIIPALLLAILVVYFVFRTIRLVLKKINVYFVNSKKKIE